MQTCHVNDMTQSDPEKFSETSLLHDLCNRESLTTYASDEAVSATSNTHLESDALNRIPVKLKHCIEKDYVHDIVVDHSTLAEELEKRMATLAELERCCLVALEAMEIDRQQRAKKFGGSQSGISSAAATPKASRTPGALSRSARLRLTGESLRKLVRMISPATRRRQHSTELHSCGSSLSDGDPTPTGSIHSVSAGCDLEFSSVALSDTNASS